MIIYIHLTELSKYLCIVSYTGAKAFPLLLNALPGKEECSFPVFRVQVIEHLHQFIASSARRVLIEKVQLCHPLAEKVSQHNSSLLIAVAILPNYIQALYRGVDDVAGILSWGEKLH